jgi:hypothetical protein
MTARPQAQAARPGPSVWSLDKQVAQARREMGEERWQQLQKEWNNG